MTTGVSPRTRAVPPSGSVGLRNRLGDMNCFLNATVQALYLLLRWAVDEFRSAVIRTSCPMQDLYACIYCCLKAIFTDMQAAIRTETQIIDITDLRRALAIVYRDTSGRFNEGCTADSIEAFTSILAAVHAVFHNDQSQGASSVMDQSRCRGCPAHNSFGFFIREDIRCACGHVNTQHWDVSCFTHEFYVGPLLDQAKSVDNRGLLRVAKDDLIEHTEESTVLNNEGRLAELMKEQWETLQLSACIDDYCRVKQSRKTLTSEDESYAFVVNCIWPATRPAQLEILQMIAGIPSSLTLDKVYMMGSATVYQLKGIIAYGGAHYVYYLRNQIWFKFNDERKTPLWTWKEVLEDMVNSQYYPTGLIYHESSAAREMEASLEDWLILERYVLERNEVRVPSPKQLSRKIPRPNEVDLTRSRSQGSSQAAEKAISEGWVCDCGFNNPLDHNLCCQSKCVKPGCSDWVCPDCTCLNTQVSAYCSACDTPRSDPETLCKFCRHSLSKWVTSCLHCSNLVSSEITSTCNFCRMPNSDAKRKCWNCLKTFKKCNKCQENFEGFSCPNCNPVRTSAPIFARREEPKTVQCKFCAKMSTSQVVCSNCNNPMDSEVGFSCLTCSRNVPLGRDSCWKCGTMNTIKCLSCGETYYTSFIHRCPVSPADLGTWECASCSKVNRDNNDFCINCNTFKNAPKTPSRQVAEVVPNDCAICRNTIDSRDPKICTFCRMQTKDWHCKDCRLTVPKDSRVCLFCLPKLQKCSNCMKNRLPHHDECKCCGFPSRNTSSARPQSRQTLRKSCSSCKQTLAPGEGRNCGQCGKRSSEEGYCNLCSCRILNHLCDRCRKSVWVCAVCGNSNFLSKTKCSCGNVNRYLLDQMF